MARFRFKIIDSTGKRRKGVLRANSLEEAQSALRSKLCQIEVLEPLPDEGRAIEVVRLESSFTQLDRIRYSLAALLTCVGIFSFAHWYRTPPRPPAAVESQEKLAFAVKGQVDTRAILPRVDGDLSMVSVRVGFPDLVYQVDGELGEDMSFSLPVSLTGSKRPTRLRVDVLVDQERWSVPESIPIPPQGDVDLGILLPRPPPAKSAGGSVRAESLESSTSLAAEPTAAQRRSPREIKQRHKQRLRDHRRRITRAKGTDG